MTPPTTDAADEAGGETVFSSDGMAPLPTPKVPPVVVSADNVYDSLQWLDTDASLVHPRSSSSMAAITVESPQERLQRLQREVEELVTDRTNSEEVSKLAKELEARLSTSTTSSSWSSAQQNLLRTIQERIDQKKEDTGVVYELYGGIVDAPVSSVEERLLTMERLVGASFSSNKSVLQRLEQVEQLVQRVNETTLEEAATRAKIIRADLEAASKARTKLGNAAVSATDAKKITELHDQLQSLQGMSAHLPALATRLEQLATLHAQGATFSNRLATVEQELPKLAKQVQQLQSCLTQVEQGMLENIKTVESNMTVLQERIQQKNSS